MRASRSAFLALFAGLPAAALLSVLARGVTGCDETPRGEQGIDYLIDGSYYSVPPSPEAGPDVFVPCVEKADPTGACAEATAAGGTPAPHLIVCVPGQSPLDILCAPPDDASTGDAGAFCCTTGVL